MAMDGGNDKTNSISNIAKVAGAIITGVTMILGVLVAYCQWQYPKSPKDVMHGDLWQQVDDPPGTKIAPTTPIKMLKAEESRVVDKEPDSLEPLKETDGVNSRAQAETSPTASVGIPQTSRVSKTNEIMSRESVKVNATTSYYSISFSSSPFVVTERDGSHTVLAFKARVSNTGTKSVLPFLGAEWAANNRLGDYSKLVTASGTTCSMTVLGGGIKGLGSVDQVRDLLARDDWSGELAPGAKTEITLSAYCPTYVHDDERPSMDLRISFADKALLGYSDIPYRSALFSAPSVPIAFQ